MFWRKKASIAAGSLSNVGGFHVSVTGQCRHKRFLPAMFANLCFHMLLNKLFQLFLTNPLKAGAPDSVATKNDTTDAVDSLSKMRLLC